MRIKLFLPILLCLLGVATSCKSSLPDLQPDGPPEVRPPVTTATPAALRPFIGKDQDYPLYAGDIVSITVQGHQDLAIVREIPPNGRIPLYGVDIPGPGGRPVPAEVTAAGKRIPELESELKGHYSRIVSPPYVTVTISSYAEKVIYVTGDGVVSPGKIPLPDRRRISLKEAITEAGWFTPNAARDRVEIVRRDEKSGTRIKVPAIDFRLIESGQNLEMDILLDPGDTITVGSYDDETVVVFGKVVQPGEYPFAPGLTLTQLISLAGGMETWAKYTDIRVIRDPVGTQSRVFHVNLEQILDGDEPDFVLAPADRIWVDERFI